MKIPLGFGASVRYGMLDWVIRTVCRLAGGSLSHVPVARPSEHVRWSAVFSELHIGNGKQFKIHAPSRESRACDTRYWRTKSQGIRFLEPLDSSLMNRDLANTSAPALVRNCFVPDCIALVTSCIVRDCWALADLIQWSHFGTLI